jgi:hypothetical protein
MKGNIEKAENGLLTYCHNGLFPQLRGKPIATTSISGKAPSSESICLHIVLR